MKNLNVDDLENPKKNRMGNRLKIDDLENSKKV
jgi:hypothetical protein